MNAIFQIEKEFDIKQMRVQAHRRYPEDATVNGVEDTEGKLLPCMVGECWCPTIDIETGRIIDWEKGKTASIHFKVVDESEYDLVDVDGDVIIHREGYVPKCMCPKENGYGDYIIMDIDSDGMIANWKINLMDFSSDDE